MNTSQQHQELNELLPFFANSTLHEVERARVEAHLRACLICRAELAQEHELMHRFRSSDSAQCVAGDGFERVMLRVRGDRSRDLVTAVRWKKRWRGRGLALAAALAGIVFGITQMNSSTKVGDQSFHTLSQDRGQTVGADIIYVAFHPAAAVGAIEAALAAVGGDVVSGPNRDHVLTVRVPSATVAAAVNKLKAHAEVKFVAAAAPDTHTTGVQP